MADEEYVKTAYEVSKERLVLAGLRLANLALDIYSDTDVAEVRTHTEIWKSLQDNLRDRPYNVVPPKMKETEEIVLSAS